MDGEMFINYRGEDSHSYGALLYVDLSLRFGPERVFLDSESIPAGADFTAELLSRVRRASVLLAVLGPQWLAVTDASGTPRIADPADWIRRELAAAFALGTRVIPVLTDGARLPSENELPADLGQLARCQYRRLRHRDAIVDLGRIASDLATADPSLASAMAGDGRCRRCHESRHRPVALPATGRRLRRSG